MDILNPSAACVLFVMSSLNCGQPTAQTAAKASAGRPVVGNWESYIAEAALRFALPEDWIKRVLQEESGGHTTLNGKPIVSPKGAMGLMQVMPDTWHDMQGLLDLGPDPFDPHDNILAGAGYLRQMRDLFGDTGAFAAYNAGPKRYSEFLSGARPLPKETRNYVDAIGVNAKADTLFVPLGPAISAAPSKRNSSPQANSLFVALSSASK